ncbi:DUF58 domain-containing protein [Clostridium thermarum]|uniref:DUF58 domain-containing protein n=1 Tax=Clostridium thermarum TaxID=1716543 RepID=UPI0013D184C6|nr:DUF58 domain-containing protein [Clostridium thermarum]
MFKIKIKFVILSILFFILAYIEGGPLFYRIFYAFAAVTLLALCVIIFNRTYLNIDIFFEKNIYSSGQVGKFDVVLNNRGILPIPYLIVVNSALKKMSSRYNGDAVNIGSCSTKKLRYEVHFRNRGVYDFGNTEARFKDTAAIIEIRKNYSTKALVHVYPRIVPVNSSIFQGLNLFNNYRISSSGIDDPYTIRDNRKYREGDSLKRINWKVSAKYNDLYVRNHEIVVGEEFNIFLDMHVSNYSYDSTGVSEEQLIDICISIVHYLAKMQIVSKLFINSANPRKFDIKEKRDFEQLMDYFLVNKSDSVVPFVQFLRIYKANDPSMNNIAFITSRVDKSLLEFAMRLEEKKKNLIIFFNQAEDTDDVNIVKLRKLGVKVIDVSEIIKYN